MAHVRISSFHWTKNAANTGHFATINITQSSRTMSNVMPSLKAIPLSRGYRRHWTGGNDKVLMSSCTAFFGRSLWQLISMILSASKLLSLLNPWSSTKCLPSLFDRWKCPAFRLLLMLTLFGGQVFQEMWGDWILNHVEIKQLMWEAGVNDHGSQNNSR